MFDDHCCQLTGGGTYVPPTGAVSRARAASSTCRRTRRRCVADYGAEPTARRRLHGRHAAAAERQRVRRLGLDPVLLRVHPLGQAQSCSTRCSPARTSATATLASRGSGCRCTRPSARRAARAAGTTTVYASWNGATQVTSWRVLAGPSASRLDASSRARPSTPASRPRSRCRALRDLRGPRARRHRPRDRDLQAVRVAQLRLTGRALVSDPCMRRTPRSWHAPEISSCSPYGV